MDLASRLKNYIMSLGLVNSEFADRAGIPRPTLSQLLTGRNKSVNDAFIKKIHEAFPTLNIAWLLFNEGNMVIDSKIQFSEAQNDENPDSLDSQNAQYQDNTNSIQQNLFGQNLESENLEQLSNSNFNNQEPNLATTRSKDTSSIPMPEVVSSQKHVASDMTLQVEQPKRVSSIMVFYSDNSFEIFKPTTK